MDATFRDNSKIKRFLSKLELFPIRVSDDWIRGIGFDSQNLARRLGEIPGRICPSGRRHSHSVLSERGSMQQRLDRIAQDDHFLDRVRELDRNNFRQEKISM